MPVDEYFQEYGPIHRRRNTGEGQYDKAISLTPPPRYRAGDGLHNDTVTFLATPRQGIEAEQRLDAAPPTARSRRRRLRRPVRRRFSLLRFLMGTLAIVLITLVLLPYAVALRYRNEALPGVTIQGMPVQGGDVQAISDSLAAHYADFLRQPVTLTYAEQTWHPSLSQLGVTFDPDETAMLARAPGRRGDPVTRLYEQWMLWRHGIDIAPRLTVDRKRLQEYLASLAPPLEHPPRDAALSVAGGNVIGTPSTPGRQVLIDESANDILLALQTLVPQKIALRTRTLDPSIGDTALQIAQEQARELLSGPLVLTSGAESWTWEPEKLAELVRVTPDDGQLLVEVDEAKLAQAVEGLAQIVDSGSVEPRLRFENGTLNVMQEGRQGRRLLQVEAVQAISETLHLSRTEARTLVLPFEELHPRVDTANLGELGIRELVGEGRSSFAGSAQYRITNIKAGAARTDGILIPPEAEFSFNTQLGEVNAENGFVEGYAVIGNRTQLEWGGGVCQNSTTVFRAAFWAGLPITERHAHPFYISWYDRFGYGEYGDGPGMDATIYTGVNDLKFVNDTGHWLLMQTYVDEVNQVLTVQLYGTRPDRRVEIDGPYISNEIAAPGTPVYVDDPSQPAGTVYQSDVARSGRDIVVYRNVIVRNGEVRQDTFFTRFKAWPNVFIRGTG